MDTSKAKKSKPTGKDPKQRKELEVTSWNVSDVRVLETRRGDLVVFTLELNGITIYNCKVATSKNGDFISFPQYKGSDDKYYSHIYAALPEEYSKVILQSIQDIINE